MVYRPPLNIVVSGASERERKREREMKREAETEGERFTI